MDRDAITRLFYSFGAKREVERYLHIFSSSSHPSQPVKFAVIGIGGIYPIVLHGAGLQMNDLLESEGVKPEYIDGIRVTGWEIRLL
ncbi:hypothetical protein BU15DRAFT_77942 [Melanogaster broomeanus]|nr:hypothetical protein BU15DRAFT_77942 [Melanogaster broomeanus]